MDYTKKEDSRFDRERDIIFTQAVRAGKRIYYLDVKRGKNDDLFLSITESKKVPVEGSEGLQFNFEKHKIFLYKEDFSKFIDALSNAIRFIHEQGGMDEDATAGSHPADADEASADALPDTSDAAADFSETADNTPVADDDLTLGDEIDLKIDF